MPKKQVGGSRSAVLNETNRGCDANCGLINRAGGMVIDTQSDLAHARRMIELSGKVWPAMAKRVVNTHEDADRIRGNQLFTDAEIQITFARLGTLSCNLAEPRGKLRSGRWLVRHQLGGDHALEPQASFGN